MDDQQALQIVNALANGVNPVTGEMFATDSPYQAPEIVRALFAASRALDRPQTTTPTAATAAAPARERARPGVPGNVGKPWTREDDERLLAEFAQGRRPDELARQFGRTLAGIEARLEKHGRLAPQQRQTVNRYVRGGSNGAEPGEHSAR